MKLATALTAIGCVMMAASMAAQRGSVEKVQPPPSGISSGLRFAGAWRPGGDGATKIVGAVIDIRQMPIPKVSVRLRNIVTGVVVATSESNDNGEYEFPDVEPGTYVVEMYIGDRYVVALSNAGAIARNETLQTVIMLPGRWDAGRQIVVPAQDFGGFAGLSSANSMSGATISFAQDQNIPPAGPGEPVSP
jgi:hypothetical protein